MSDKKLRLSKLMAERGICSRRKADELIEKGCVQVDGQVVDRLGSQVNPQVEITLSDKAQQEILDLKTIMLHKPIGYVCSQAEHGHRHAMSLLTGSSQAPPRKKFSSADLKNLAPVGRLDIDSKGLLLLTQDGQLARQIIGPNAEVEKEYLVRVQGEIIAERLKQLRHGLSLDDKPLKKADVRVLKPQVLRFILTEGKKRQIRRMCELVQLEVVWLKRIRIGSFHLGSLKEGQWRFVERHERIRRNPS